MSDAEQQALTKEILEIRQILDHMARQDSSTKTAFDTLYKELEQYKSEFVLSMEKSLLLDLLSFFDSLVWFQNTLEEKPESASENLQYLMDEFLEVLRRRDVHAFTAQEKFNRKLHRVIQVNDAENQDDDGRIQSVLRRGFSRGERNLRDEEVVILRYTPPPEEKPSTSNDVEEDDSWQEDNTADIETDGDDEETDKKQSNGIQIQAVSQSVNENEEDSAETVDDSIDSAHNDD